MENLKCGVVESIKPIRSCFATEKGKIVTITASSVLLSVWLYNFLFNDQESIIERTKKTIFTIAKMVPQIKNKIDSELKVVKKSFQNDIIERSNGASYITVLPMDPYTKEDLMSKVDETLNLGNYDWKKGYCSGSVYYHSPELIQLITEVYGKTSYTNPLHCDIFPGVCKMESEVVRMSVGLFNGDDKCCGTMTTGGTESIIMACKALRDYAREVRGVKKPEMVVPVTIHCAFDKAAKYLGIRVRSIPVDIMYRADIRAMKKAINSNTVMLAGSAPNFPYGTMDDIQAISELGVRYGIPVHVDSCLGGFLTAFMEEAGYPCPPCDFRLPGVTSISADTHKYGCAPKGTSVILYKDIKYRHHQYTVTTDWPGGVYGSPTVNGSRAGGNIAVCWATMLSFGRDGYVKATREVIRTTKYIEKHLRAMQGMFIFGQPATSVIALGSNDFHIFRLADAMSKEGWNLNTLQYPSGIHLCVTHMHTQPGVADKFIGDVRKSLDEILRDPQLPVEGKLAMYGTSQTIPDRSIVGDFTRYFIDATYYTPVDKIEDD